jgi:hypothetical protein
MSGSAGGLLLLPLLFGVVPVMGTVLIGGAVAAAASAAATAASNYERDRRAERERIRQREETERIGGFRDQLKADMLEETQLNVNVSKRMEKELEQSRKDAADILSGGDPEKYRQYLEKIQKSRAEAGEKMVSMQNEFAAKYNDKIAGSMEILSGEISKKYAEYMGEFKNLSEAGEKKRELARDVAKIYIDEAANLIESLRGDIGGADFSCQALNSLAAQLQAASAQFDNGQYEACIAVAKDASVSAIEEIYRADLKKQEWENYHKLALTLASEIEAYMKGQEVITETSKKEMENRAGHALNDELIGARIADYTDKTQSGETQFDYLLNLVSSQKAELESSTPASISASRLREIASDLNARVYPAVMTSIYKGMLNISNAFTRQNLSEEIIDFFEEHNFTFKGYGYENDRHDGALSIGLENAATGEEIIVTLAPEMVGASDVQTRVSIDQLKGDERNEERKAYYRDSVRDVVANCAPGASMNLECERSTRNKLSPRTDLREKLKS